MLEFTAGQEFPKTLYGMCQCASFDWFHSHSVSALGSATQPKVREGAIYEAAIIAEHTGAGMLFMSNLTELNG